MESLANIRDYSYLLNRAYDQFFPISAEAQAHRRLQSGPSWVDFVVIVGLGMILFYMLKVLQRISDNWRQMMKDRITKALQKRKDVKDTFRNTYGYSWDYVMVFKVHEADKKLTKIQNEKSVKYIINALAESGLQTKMFYSVQNDELYLKIRCPLKRLMKEADRINYRLLLEPTALGNKLRLGNAKGPVEKHWKPVDVPSSSIETTIDPYDYIYSDYRMEEDDADLYKKWPNGSIFRGVDRLKLIAGILAARTGEGGCHLDVYRLIKDGCMIAFFPLHDAVELRELEEKWLRICQPPWLQHVDIVKDYFGEKIGMFFLWLGHYTTWLLPAAIIGFFAWINVASDDNNPSAAVMPYFATFIAIWSTLFLEYWKRKEKTAAMRWGTVGFEDEEQARPEFEGEIIHSPVNGQEMRYFPRNEFLFRVCMSTNVISVLVMVVLAVVAGIFTLRIFLSQMRALVVGGTQLGGIITALINAIQIQVLNAIYNVIAIRLTQYENHRTDTEYEDSLIAKTFIFQFVNSFASLFYIAFIKPYISDIDPCIGSCMSELQASLGTIFLTRLATGSLLKILIPYMTKKQKEKSETKGADIDDLTDVELAYIQQEYHVMLGPFADYANLVIQFGYATMFIAAYPLAMTMSFISNYVEMRVDAWKLCQLCRRPEPRSCEDIGTWYTILEIISFAAVLVNSGLVAFTGNNAINYTWPERIWIFFGMSFGIMMVKYIIAIYVPDTPQEVDIQLKRQEFFLSKIVDNVPDDDNEALVKNSHAENKYVVRVNDDDPL